MKKTALSLAAINGITYIFAHEAGTEEFTGGVNPIEYFVHGYYLYGLLIIGFWILILWGIYTLAIMVIGNHIK